MKFVRLLLFLNHLITNNMKKLILFTILLSSKLLFAQDRCKNCEKLYEEKKFEEIIKTVKPLGDKASVNDLVFLGLSYQSLGDKKNAIKAYETLLLIDDKNVEACVAVSALFIDIGQYENAKFAAERALKFDKKNKKALYNLGVIHYYKKEYDKFDAHVNKYMKDKEAKADFTYLKAVTKIDQEKFDEAFKILADLEEIDPNFENLAFYQGYCLFKDEKFEEAKEKFTKASSVKNEMVTEAYYYLAHTNIKLDNKVDACEAFNNAINLGDQTLIREADDYCIEKKNKKFKQVTRNVRVTL
jgi:tetratricopeptide (TPR) repeat protein